MHVIVTKHALADIDECDAWWRANRPDAPDLVRSELAGALESLAESAQTLPVFRQLATVAIRRFHVARVHRHVYLAIRGDTVVVLAVWGAVRSVLPALRARMDRATK